MLGYFYIDIQVKTTYATSHSHPFHCIPYLQLDNPVNISYAILMDKNIDNLPATSYDLLAPTDKRYVDEYVSFAVAQQLSKRERIINALQLPIPQEFVARSNQALAKLPLRIAVAERLRQEADKQDLGPDRLLKEYGALAFSKLSDFLIEQPYGYALKDLKDIPHQSMGAIKTVEMRPTQFGMAYKLVLHDKQPALRALAEMMGMVSSDKQAILVEHVKPVNTIDASYTESVDSEASYVALLEDVNR